MHFSLLPRTANQARLCVILTAVGYSFMGLAFKYVDWNPMAIMCIRSAVSIPLIMLIGGKNYLQFTKRTLVGACFAFATSTCFVIANKLTSATNAIVLQYTNPLFVVLFCVLVRKEKMARKDLWLMILIFAGMVLFFLDGLSAGNLIGNGVALLSGIAMAGSTLYACYSRVDITDYTLIAHILSVGVGLPFMLMDPPKANTVSVTAVVLMSFFCVSIPHFLYRLGVRKISAVETSVLLMLDPILNPIWIAVILGEIPSMLSLAGAALVILSVLYWCISGAKSAQAN